MVVKHRARGREKIDVKTLIAFVNGVAIDRNVESLAGFAGGEGEDSIYSHIVGACGCAAVLACIIDRYRRA